MSCQPDVPPPVDKMIAVRPAVGADFPHVLRLLRQLWPDKPMDPAALEAVFNRAVATPNRYYFLAAEGENAVGLISMTIKDNLWQEGLLAWLDELVVDADHRRLGIGTRLIEHVISLAREKGCRRIELDSAFHRRQAHVFYDRLGFGSRALLFSKTL
jgi:GNAT superfamily N-acetyltransferase